MRCEIAEQLCNFRKTIYLKALGFFSAAYYFAFIAQPIYNNNNDQAQPIVFRQVTHPLSASRHVGFFFLFRRRIIMVLYSTGINSLLMALK